MRCGSICPRAILLLAAFGLALAAPSVVFGQAGVVINADGVLSTKTEDPTGQLTRDRKAAERTKLGSKVASYSKIRYISLNRLEAALHEKNNVPTAEMSSLAGLLRIQYVFYFPDSKDIVIAGPAEGWINDGWGRPVGLSSGRPVVRLEDLVVALRAFPPDKKVAPVISCSIDPTQEGLAAMKATQGALLRQMGGQYTPEKAEIIVTSLKTSLGPQTIRINGVSPKTHFAMSMIEADYRMKLIGIGLEPPPVRMKSWVDGVHGAAGSTLQRWYFVPDYECVRTADDGMAMELVGDGVKLIGEKEFISAQGERRAAGRAGGASQAFVTAFTKKYPQIAEKSIVYAELRNLIDLAVAAAYIQHEDFYGKAKWNMDVFGDEKTYSVETYDVPKQVEAAINAIWRAPTLMTPIGGGVQIQATRALAADKRLADKDGKVGKLRQQTTIRLKKGQWWWD